MHQLDTNLRGEINGLRSEMQQLDTHLRGEMQQLDTHLRGEMQQLDTNLRGEMQQLDTNLRGELQQHSDRHGEVLASHSVALARLDERMKALPAEVTRSILFWFVPMWLTSLFGAVGWALHNS